MHASRGIASHTLTHTRVPSNLMCYVAAQSRSTRLLSGVRSIAALRPRTAPTGPKPNERFINVYALQFMARQCCICHACGLQLPVCCSDPPTLHRAAQHHHAGTIAQGSMCHLGARNGHLPVHHTPRTGPYTCGHIRRQWHPPWMARCDGTCVETDFEIEMCVENYVEIETYVEIEQCVETCVENAARCWPVLARSLTADTNSEASDPKPQCHSPMPSAHLASALGCTCQSIVSGVPSGAAFSLPELFRCSWLTAKVRHLDTAVKMLLKTTWTWRTSAASDGTHIVHPHM